MDYDCNVRGPFSTGLVGSAKVLGLGSLPINLKAPES